MTSSTGDGEFPDDAFKFARFVLKTKKKAKKDEKLTSLLSHFQYTLLGLGDSDYTSFMKAPIDLKTGLDAIGAKFFYEFGKADEATSMETAIEPWINGLWDALKS
jgi:sulfite reductase alpha subunit-like flavoprotein